MNESDFQFFQFELYFNSISVSYMETGHEQDKRWLGKNICFFGLISPYDLSRFLAGTLKSVKIELWATAFQLESGRILSDATLVSEFQIFLYR